MKDASTAARGILLEPACILPQARFLSEFSKLFHQKYYFLSTGRPYVTCIRTFISGFRAYLFDLPYVRMKRRRQNSRANQPKGNLHNLRLHSRTSRFKLIMTWTSMPGLGRVRLAACAKLLLSVPHSTGTVAQKAFIFFSFCRRHSNATFVSSDSS